MKRLIALKSPRGQDLEIGLKASSMIIKLFPRSQGILVAYFSVQLSDPFCNDFRSMLFEEIRQNKFCHTDASPDTLINFQGSPPKKPNASLPILPH